MKEILKDKDMWRKIKPWVFLSTYILFLGTLLIHVTQLLSLIGYVLSLFRSLLYAIGIAYVLNLPMRMIEGCIVRHTKEADWLRKHKRLFSMLLTFVLALILIVLIGSIILPNIIDSLLALIQNLSSFFLDIVRNIDGILASMHVDLRIEDITQVENFLAMPWEQILTNIISFLSGSASGILSGAGSFVSSFVTCFTAFMFSLYLLYGKENFIRQLRKTTAAFLGYEKAGFVFAYAHKVNRIFANFIGGQLTEACIIWVLYFVLMNVFRFPFTELICTLIALFSLVPVFGPTVAMCIAAIMMLSVDPLLSLWFIVFFQIVSYFEDNLIYPRIVGNSVGLPGIWVLLSIFVLGNIWGVLGMLIAVPLTACIYVFFAELVQYLLKKRKLYVDEVVMRKQSDAKDE